MSDPQTIILGGGRAVLYRGDAEVILPAIRPPGPVAVVTDPPYGIRSDEAQHRRAGKQGGHAVAPSGDYGTTQWDRERPPESVFKALLSLSREVVIFGGEHFALPLSRGWIVWDKDNGDNFYADCELAWTSLDRPIRKIKWRWQGMIQEEMGEGKERRFHPTQKPVGVMAWVLGEYTQPGATILDPYMGSGSTGVACMRAGRRFVGIEREGRYFDTACARIQAAIDPAVRVCPVCGHEFPLGVKP
jgi:hypothetical protein